MYAIDVIFGMIFAAANIAESIICIEHSVNWCCRIVDACSQLTFLGHLFFDGDLSKKLTIRYALRST